MLIGLVVGTSHAAPDNPPIPIDELTSMADQVIVGTVLATRDNVDQDGLWTTVTVRVAETLRGTPAMVVEVRIPGGRIDNLEMRVMGAPMLLPGDDVLLFLYRDRVVGFGQGAFVVANQRAWRAMNDWGFMHPDRLDAKLPDKHYYVSLDMGTVRTRIKAGE